MESQEDSPAATGDERADGDLEPSPDLRDARAQVFTQARECTPEPVKADAKRNRSPSDADPSGQPAPAVATTSRALHLQHLVARCVRVAVPEYRQTSLGVVLRAFSGYLQLVYAYNTGLPSHAPLTWNADRLLFIVDASVEGKHRAMPLTCYEMDLLQRELARVQDRVWDDLREELVSGSLPLHAATTRV